VFSWNRTAAVERNTIIVFGDSNFALWGKISCYSMRQNATTNGKELWFDVQVNTVCDKKPPLLEKNCGLKSK
jgi:hypothetical protein